MRDVDGGLPAADVVAVEHAARVLRRSRRLEAWLDLYGESDEATGEPKPAARLADELGRSLDRSLDALGMTLSSRAKLGPDLARSARLDAATALSAARVEEDPVLRAAILRRAGIVAEGPTMSDPLGRVKFARRLLGVDVFAHQARPVSHSPSRDAIV